MRTFPLWLALLLASFDLHAQTPVPAAPTPFWLGDPGVDVEKARAAVHRREAERLRWEQATSVGDYERIGQQDPRWDADVHKAFDQYVHLLAQETNARTVGAKPAIQRAQALGCQDPMLSFMYLELKFYPSGIDEAALAKMY